MTATAQEVRATDLKMTRTAFLDFPRSKRNPNEAIWVIQNCQATGLLDRESISAYSVCNRLSSLRLDDALNSKGIKVHGTTICMVCHLDTSK